MFRQSLKQIGKGVAGGIGFGVGNTFYNNSKDIIEELKKNKSKENLNNSEKFNSTNNSNNSTPTPSK
jgi:hypothetical protein